MEGHPDLSFLLSENMNIVNFYSTQMGCLAPEHWETVAEELRRTVARARKIEVGATLTRWDIFRHCLMWQTET